MKTLKIQILSIMLILSSTLFYAQEPAKINMSVSFQDIFNSKKLVMNLEGDVKAKNWNKDYVLIEMKIKATNVSLGVAKYLISKERFCLKLQPLEDGSLVLYMPNFKLPVYINGKRLSEDIFCQVYAPQGINIEVLSFDNIFPCPPERESLAKSAKEIDPSASRPASGKEQGSPSL